MYLNTCLVAVILIFYSNSFSQSNVEKIEAIKKYKSEFLIRKREFINLHGNNKDNCNEGWLSKKDLKIHLTRINYFRSLCKLSPVNFTKINNSRAQKVANFIAINHKLSHFPDKSWICYTDSIASYSSQTDLLYRSGFDYETRSIVEFINDEGADNFDACHRASILFSELKEIGYGATSRSEAIYSDLNTNTNSSLLFFSYPTSGYNSIDLIFNRWSFYIPKHLNVNFENSKVEIIDERNEKLKIKINTFKRCFDNQIVWEFEKQISKEILVDKVFNIKISNIIIDGKIKEYEYQVKFFKAN